VVVVKAAQGGDISIQGLPAGLYGSIHDECACRHRRAGSGRRRGTLSTNIPAGGDHGVLARRGAAPAGERAHLPAAGGYGGLIGEKYGRK
jgi:hypothetical protein